MTLYITGFIVALVLAVLVLIWIAYCMFIRERHKSEYYQYNISDLKHRSSIMNQNEDEEVSKSIKKDIAVGMFVLPSKHKQKDESFDQRPDYPESPVHVSPPSTAKLIDMLDEDAGHYKDGIYEVDSRPAHHSEV